MAVPQTMLMAMGNYDPTEYLTVAASDQLATATGLSISDGIFPS